MIWNLLSNAVKFTPKGGRIDVRIRQHGSPAQVVVADSGSGYLLICFRMSSNDSGRVTVARHGRTVASDWVLPSLESSWKPTAAVPTKNSSGRYSGWRRTIWMTRPNQLKRATRGSTFEIAERR